jgi:hypothetical protein
MHPAAVEPATIRLVLRIGFYLLVLWYVVLVAGTIQYRVLKRKTIEMILARAERMPDADREHLPERVYEALYPEWCDMVRRSAWFIPSKSELRPIPATAENVKVRFGFSPRWVQECLKDKRPELLRG